MVGEQVKHGGFSKRSLVFVQSRAEVARGFVENERYVFLGEMKEVASVRDRFGPRVELETDVLGDRAVNGHFARPNRLLGRTL